MSGWLYGHLSSGERIWSAAAPGIVLLVYLVLAFGVYRVRFTRGGRYRDAEAEGRPAGGLSSRSLRLFFTWLMEPWIAALARLRVPPDAVTSLSVFLTVGAAIAVAIGRFSLGGWLYLVASLCDFVDGRLARRTGRATPAGALLDAVLDRCTEGAMLVGLAWFYRDRWVLLLALTALTGSMLVPYIRAKGEALGTALAAVGFMQRPERVLLLGTTVALSPIVEALVVPDDPRPVHRLAVAGLAVLAVASNVTAVTRASHLFRALAPGEDADEQPSGARQWRAICAVSLGFAVDLLALHLLLAHGATPRPLASAVCYVLGAAVRLLVLGNAAWRSAPEGVPARAWWSFVVVSGAALCGGGSAVLALLPLAGEVPAWLAVRIAVHLTWIRPLLGHRFFGLFIAPASHRA